MIRSFKRFNKWQNNNNNNLTKNGQGAIGQQPVGGLHQRRPLDEEVEAVPQVAAFERLSAEEMIITLGEALSPLHIDNGQLVADLLLGMGTGGHVKKERHVLSTEQVDAARVQLQVKLRRLAEGTKQLLLLLMLLMLGVAKVAGVEHRPALPVVVLQQVVQLLNAPQMTEGAHSSWRTTGPRKSAEHHLLQPAALTTRSND